MGTAPRIQVGDATGTWRCRINDEMLTLKDLRLIHRVIDIEFAECRRSRKQRKITEQLRKEKEERDALLNAVQEADALENERAALEAAEQAKTNPTKAVNEVTKTETEKVTKTP